ncbi:MAG: hypothetical protein ACXV3D_07425 [Halobacteriota archaeon]
MPTGTVINGAEDIIAAILELFESAQHQAVFLAPPSFVSLAGALDTVKSAEQFVQNGGVLRGITTVSHTNVKETRKRLDFGEDLRHCDVLSGIFMFVVDRQQSVSSINIGVREYTVDTPVIAFKSVDPTYAEYLLASFENAWSQGVPAEEQIKELEK